MDTRKQRELELWKRWKSTNDQMALQELMESLRPIVKQTSGVFSRSGLPMPVIEGESKRIILEALNDFDPKKNPGVQLSTFIISRSKKLNRMIYKHQNIGRISEQRITQIGTFNNVKQFLKDKQGYEPSAMQMSDELNWSLPEVERMERESRKDLIGSVQDFETGLVISDRDKEVLDFVYFELTPEEQTVYDYLLGKHGKQQLKPTQIAQRTGMSPAKVSRLRNSIRDKFQRHAHG